MEEGRTELLYFLPDTEIARFESGGSYLLAYDTIFLNNYSANSRQRGLAQTINQHPDNRQESHRVALADACRSGDFTLAGDFIRGRYRVWEWWQHGEPRRINLLSSIERTLLRS